MNLYLLRHAQSCSNRNAEQHSPHMDVLSPHGERQAQNIVAQLATLKIQQVLCSNLPRALATITPFIDRHPTPMTSHACLAEGHYMATHPGITTPPQYKKGFPIKNESDEQFMARVMEAEQLIRQQAVDNLLVVSHGHMLRELINRMLITSSPVRFPHDNCGLSHLQLTQPLQVHCINRIILTIESSA